MIYEPLTPEEVQELGPTKAEIVNRLFEILNELGLDKDPEQV